jgi:CRISPR-associated protein Cas1
MTVLYVKEPGSVIRREVERIKVTRRPRDKRVDELLHSISVRDLEQVVIYGNVQLTTQAAALLLENEIDVVFLSHYGKFRGRLGQDGSKFARLRHAQLRLAGDDARALGLALSIVAAKLANQRGVLVRLGDAAAPEVRQALQQAADGIEQMRGASRQAKTLDALRGFEGKGGVYYFGALKRVLAPRWAFAGRQYHPAPDPFNALLSFGYALLQKDMSATIHLVGLDPYVGCFHALEYGRPSLTLDLMEEFRPLTVDEPLLALVLAGRLKPEDFTYTGRAERPVELGEGKMAPVIAAYEARLAQTVLHTDSHTQQTLRRCMELQARIYGRVVMETRQGYQGLVV